MKAETLTRRQAITLPFLGILALVLFAGTPSSFAAHKSYNTHVTILDYYGFRGHDSQGKRLYAVKVQHEDNYYYVELNSAMACLARHYRDCAMVNLCRENGRWEHVTFHGQSSNIHRIVKLRSCNSSLPSYRY